ncbi:hypothetical protein MMC15_007149 [Xylographa vitiligo]|nr:hypothetical protein [Xylographa vitiligo]
MEILHERPLTSSFTPLSEHQSRTPSSFYSSTAVLYHHSASTKLIILEYEALASSPLAKLADAPPTNVAATNGDTDHSMSEEIVVEGVDVWVTSEYDQPRRLILSTLWTQCLQFTPRKFILYRPSIQTGVSIPYPSISLHAIQSHISGTSTSAPVQGLYMQLDTSDGFDDHDPADTIALTIIPSQSISLPAEPRDSAPPSLSADHETPSIDLPQPDSIEPPVQTLFAALTACANLHPDPASPGSVDEMDEGQDPSSYVYQSGDVAGAAADGLPPPMPGSGGWITAENMGDYFDEEGNWRSGELGAGAGVVRAREEHEEEGGDEGNGHGDDEDEAKRRRTE